jgi:hypothetical protein
LPAPMIAILMASSHVRSPAALVMLAGRHGGRMMP